MGRRFPTLLPMPVALKPSLAAAAGTLTIRALEVPASADKAGGADPKQPHF